ncbi:MAG: hypothetical protein AAFN07_15000 [Pseudomonadota bacterium]
MAELIRHWQSSASLVVEDYAPELSSDHLRRLSRHFSRRSERSERWRNLWWAATLGSLCSQMFSSDGSAIDAMTRKALVSFATEKFDLRIPSSPTGVLRRLLHQKRGGEFKRTVESWTDDQELEDIVNILNESIPSDAPVVIAVEEPATVNDDDRPHWHHCVAGMMYCAQRLADSKLGQKVWFICAIEDTVYRLELLGNCALKSFAGRPFVRKLKWKKDGALEFLDKKLRGLKPEHLINPITSDAEASIDKLCEHWLGVECHEYSDDEEISALLIRHTRYLPRDIVYLCNELAASVANAVKQNQNSVSTEAFFHTLTSCSRTFAEEQVARAANDLVCRRTRQKFGQSGSSQYLGEGDQFSFILDALKILLRDCFQDTGSCDSERLRTLVTGVCTNIDLKEYELLRVLWQYRVVGIVDKKGIRFSETYELTQFPDGDSTLLPNSYIRRAYDFPEFVATQE